MDIKVEHTFVVYNNQVPFNLSTSSLCFNSNLQHYDMFGRDTERQKPEAIIITTVVK